jgi:hypothetical protein
VFAAVNDVARETTEAEGEFAGEVEKGAGGDEDGAEDEEGAAEIARRIHRVEFSANGWVGWRGEKKQIRGSLAMTGFWRTNDTLPRAG